MGKLNEAERLVDEWLGEMKGWGFRIERLSEEIRDPIEKVKPWLIAACEIGLSRRTSDAGGGVPLRQKIDAILQSAVEPSEYPKSAHRFFQSDDAHGDRWRTVNAIMEALSHPAPEADRIGTHYDGCWLSGPRHYGCATRRIAELEAEVGRWHSAYSIAHDQATANGSRAAELEAAWLKAEAQLSEISHAIGTVRFMDPPDGGDVSLADQVRRMKSALDGSEALLDEAVGYVSRFIDLIDRELSMDPHWLVKCRFLGGPDLTGARTFLASIQARAVADRIDRKGEEE